MLVRTLQALSILSVMACPALAAPKVVVSIKPIHSIVANLMAGIGEPALLVDGAASPHTYQLRPSQAAALQDADLIIWMGDGMEHFLGKPLETLAQNARIVELDEAPGLVTLPFRQGGAFDTHDDGDAPEGPTATDGHDHAEVDMHLWLDPDNARIMADAIALALIEKDPANRSIYQANLVSFDKKLAQLTTDLGQTIAPVKDRPFIVFHDAYQYFEKRFGVRVAGSITVSPENAPGAERLSEIRAKISEIGATCVFAEPQFAPRVIQSVIEGTSAKMGTLDPEGGSLDAGPDLYFQLLRSIATNLRDCLASG